MAPRNVETQNFNYVEDELTPELEPAVTAETVEAKRPPTQLVWRNIIWIGWLHAAALYGIYCVPFANPMTWLWTFLMYGMGALGITAGAHRLWAHRSYKARLPLRILLTIFNSMAFQNDVIEWSRDHRVHHKYSETDADPHNANRGLFFSHVGWLLCRKHPDVKVKGRNIDMADLLADPVLMIQRKLYLPSVLLLCFVFPVWVPMHFWGETFTCALYLAILRYVVSLNVTWTVNSLAHMYGNKPYDAGINPSENFFVAFGAIGEGFHNYHHVFPSDYSTSEFGWYVNFTSLFLDTMALFGQVYDRKKMSYDMVFRRKQRTGDGTEGFVMSAKSTRNKTE